MIGIPANKNSDPNEIWDMNYDMIKGNITDDITEYLNKDLYDFFVEEVGVEKIVKYLLIQDKIEMQSFNSPIDFGNFPRKTKMIYLENKEKDFDDEDDIVTSNKPKYNIDVIKFNLLKYFLNELVEDIPTNSILRDREDVRDFIKMYELKFLHEFLIPISESKNNNPDN